LKIEPELLSYRSKESGGELVRKGPIGLIICASYDSAEKIKRQLEHLLRGTTLEVYATIGAETEGKLKANLRKNPEFFIVKADVALRLWETCFYDYFRFERFGFGCTIHEIETSLYHQLPVKNCSDYPCL